MDATWYFVPRVLREGEFKDACEQALAAVLHAPTKKFVVRHPRRDGRAGVREDDIYLGVDSLRSILDLSKIDLVIDADTGLVKDGITQVYIIFRTSAGLVETHALGNESVAFLERLALTLGLERSEPPEDDSEELKSRLAALERAFAQFSEKLRCFISFKFDDTRTVEQTNVLKRMLTALNIEWTTGEQFEPRRIEDKVKSRLRADVDFLIGVITKAGQSSWIRDELGNANARGIFVIVLKEEGASFDPGIFGSLEYIPYNTIIEQTFPPLVEGINFIRAEITTRHSSSLT